MNKRIGIIGGSFNPPHYAHLFMGIEALYRFNLEKVLFIPANIPPHKEENLISAYHRLKMVELAIESEKKFQVSDMEIRRGGISYTIDTLRDLKREYDEGWEIYFIAGSDSALDLPNWREPEAILELCTFTVFERPNYPFIKVKSDFRRKMLLVDSLLLDISSQEIRRRIREGRPVKYLLPLSVEKYISENSLYR
ncbi:nicotinate-nucleotide adenylyltransferase [Candidatus Calescamantes bacterium]|nr:nicotinate-nucleotide adenylyltransferase [Candidatus Calescamantes bacterium]